MINPLATSLLIATRMERDLTKIREERMRALAPRQRWFWRRKKTRAEP